MTKTYDQLPILGMAPLIPRPLCINYLWILKNIFIGHYGTGKTLLASQILKIKSAQFKKNNKNVKKYVFEYNELIGQLQLDPEQKWLYEYSELYNEKPQKYTD